jgi:hypothetical protein
MLRKVSFFIVLAILLSVPQSCSQVPENNDPVIGIWSRTETETQTDLKASVREEWIFNDVNLGRYHRYEGGAMSAQSDFQWNVQGKIYTIVYPNLERLPDQVIIQHAESATLLLTQDGETLARRE